MKRIIFIALIFATFLLMNMINNSCADVYVLYDKRTNEVLSISKQDDAVKPDSNYLVRKIKGNVSDFIHDAKFYKIDGNTLSLNISKKTEDDKKKQDFSEKTSEQATIELRAFKNACLQLEGEGVVFKQISCSDYD